MENPDDVKIRKMKPEDCERLFDLWDETGLHFKPHGRDRKEKIAAEMKGPQACFLVAEDRGTLIGSILATHDGRKGWINRLAVAPRYRRKGVGERLIKEAEKYFDGEGIEIVACLIEEENEPSLSLFRKAGFHLHRDIFYLSKRKSEST
jgi:ribosomal protein S18 acetylase RimI-like enzyme